MPEGRLSGARPHQVFDFAGALGRATSPASAEETGHIGWLPPLTSRVETSSLPSGARPHEVFDFAGTPSSGHLPGERGGRQVTSAGCHL